MSDFWIQTASGIDFDLLEPEPSMVSLDDIASALSMQARYNGQIGFYSVAEHSVRVSWRVEELLSGGLPKYITGTSLAGLLHDASEAYTGDVVAPLKRALRYIQDSGVSAFDQIEACIQTQIMSKFGLLLGWSAPEIKRADLELLATEKRDLVPHIPGERPWSLTHAPLPDMIRPWSAAFARNAFVERFRDLERSLLR